jgi:hypothetical protein
MNKKLIFSVLLICLLVFVAVMAFSQSSPSSNVRWEYTTLIPSDDNAFKQGANALGQEGWELVSTGTGWNTRACTFKRRLP